MLQNGQSVAYGSSLIIIWKIQFQNLRKIQFYDLTEIIDYILQKNKLDCKLPEKNKYRKKGLHRDQTQQRGKRHQTTYAYSD